MSVKSRLALLAAAVNNYTFKSAWGRNGAVYVLLVLKYFVHGVG